jgi:hypothetical protein
MHILFYCSVANQEMSDDAILDILKVAREHNSQKDITGILVFQKKTREFMQILEGKKEAVFDLLDKIQDDERHTSLELVYDKEVEERTFKNWSMAFADLDTVDKSKLEGVSEFLEKGFTSELLKENPAKTSRLIKTFKTFIEND